MRRSVWCKIHTLMRLSHRCEEHTTQYPNVEFFFYFFGLFNPKSHHRVFFLIHVKNLLKNLCITHDNFLENIYVFLYRTSSNKLASLTSKFFVRGKRNYVPTARPTEISVNLRCKNQPIIEDVNKNQLPWLEL